MNNWRIGVMMIGAWLAALPGTGLAQESFPNRAVRIVVPYAPGSVTDHRQAADCLAPLKQAAKALEGARWVLGRAATIRLTDDIVDVWDTEGG